MKALLAAAAGVVSVFALAACGGGYGAPASTPATSTSSAGSGTNAAAKFSTRHVSGVGNVVVDGKGRTVYILTSASKKNVPCSDASGCTGVWPDLPFADGTTAATAGPGLDAMLLGTKKLSDGETYPTYDGYLLYEYTGDTANGQANGEGIKSFGGTWYVLSSSGRPVQKSSSGGGYRYP